MTIDEKVTHHMKRKKEIVSQASLLQLPAGVMQTVMFSRQVRRQTQTNIYHQEKALSTSSNCSTILKQVKPTKRRSTIITLQARASSLFPINFLIGLNPQIMYLHFNKTKYIFYKYISKLEK